MDFKTFFSEKLEKIIFVEIDEQKLSDFFPNLRMSRFYLPIRAERIIYKVKEENDVNEMPLAFFIEGMFYILGADENFKYNNEYIKLLSERNESTKFIKRIIYDELKAHNKTDAYILLKGLIKLEFNFDNYDKLILIADDIRKIDSNFRDEELSIIDKVINEEGYATPALYKSIILNEEKDYENALFNLNNYLEKGGEETIEITEFRHNLINLCNYNKGQQLAVEDPSEALKLLLPLLDEYGDSADLYYYIALAYRVSENHEKAIYYLNEALGLQSGDTKIINELGINYAAIGDYDKAIAYLRKAFEITRSIEICTNLIMCYLNTGDLVQARLHFEIAEKIDADDEVVRELSKIINNINV